MVVPRLYRMMLTRIIAFWCSVMASVVSRWDAGYVLTAVHSPSHQALSNFASSGNQHDSVRHTEARSRHNCCRGKVRSSKYFGCVSVLALGIRHANRIFSAPYIVAACGLPGCLLFYILSHKRVYFRGKKYSRCLWPAWLFTVLHIIS